MLDFSRLRISFIAGTLGQGGAERQLHYILRSLRDLGARVELLTFTKDEHWEPYIRELGVPIRYVGQSPLRAIRLTRILTVLHYTKPHIIQSQHSFTNLYAAISARILNSKDIGAIRSDFTHELQSLGRLGRANFSLPQWIVANSRVAIQKMAHMGIRSTNVFYLPNIVDTELFHPKRRQDRPVSVLLSAGRLSKEKRFDRFLSVLAKLNKTSTGSIKAIIAGDGPFKNHLVQQARELELLGSSVEFVGSISDLTSTYQGSDIFVSTSDWEGTPNVVLEAMSCGLPVVASNVGGVSEIIQDGVTGFLLEPNNENGFVQTLLRLIGDISLRQETGGSARQYIQEHHAPTRLTQHLETLYEMVLK